MSGRSRLKPHCGPTNARLRVHVGLSVPEGAGLRVGNETRAWIVGGAIAFDDSFEHEVCLSMCNEWFVLERGGVSFLQSTAETCIHVYHSQVWNDSDEDRLVFIVDCWHPALRTDEQRKAALRDGGGLAKYESASWFAMSGQELPVEEDAVANRRTKVRF